MISKEQIQKRRQGWFVIAWAFLIFFTSCFFISVDTWLAVVRRVVPIPTFQGKFNIFWLYCGFFVVKTWHATEYGILATLIFLALRSRLALRSALTISFFLAVLFAASDEWHQTFVPGREGCVRDVIIDSVGAAIALAIWAAKSRRAADLNSR